MGDPEFYWVEKPEDKGKLQWYIDRARDCKIFDIGAWKRANKIRNLANDVSHEQTVPDEGETRVCLEHLRESIQSLSGAPCLRRNRLR